MKNPFPTIGSWITGVWAWYWNHPTGTRIALPAALLLGFLLGKFN